MKTKTKGCSSCLWRNSCKSKKKAEGICNEYVGETQGDHPAKRGGKKWLYLC